MLYRITLVFALALVCGLAAEPAAFAWGSGGTGDLTFDPAATRACYGPRRSVTRALRWFGPWEELHVSWEADAPGLSVAWWRDEGDGGMAYSAPHGYATSMVPERVLAPEGTASLFVFGYAPAEGDEAQVEPGPGGAGRAEPGHDGPVHGGPVRSEPGQVELAQAEPPVLVVERWTFERAVFDMDGPEEARLRVRFEAPPAVRVERLVTLPGAVLASATLFHDRTTPRPEVSDPDDARHGIGAPRTLLLMLEGEPSVFALDLLPRGDREPEALVRIAGGSGPQSVGDRLMAADELRFRGTGSHASFGQVTLVRAGEQNRGDVVVVRDRDFDGVPDSVRAVPLGWLEGLSLVGADGWPMGFDPDHPGLR